MKLKRIFVSVFSFAVVFSLMGAMLGCQQEVRYSPSEISQYPQATQKLIEEGKVSMGMTPNQVRFAWGAPNEVKILPPTKTGQSRQEWVYKDELSISETRLFFTDGHVTEMTSKGLSSRKFVSPNVQSK